MNNDKLKISEKNYERYKKLIQEFVLLDDTFMRKVFEDVKCSELVLKIIMEKDDLQITQLKIQADMKNLQGRSIIMDVLAKDKQGTIYNIEVQRENSGATPKRARYHSGLLDMNILEPSESIENLPKTYVIFITENDVLKGNLPIYHIQRTIKELGNTEFNDNSHIIYVNSSIQDDSKLGRLMHDFRCKEVEEIYYKELKERIWYYKKDEEGARDMCRISEMLREEGRLEGMAEGRLEGEEKGIQNIIEVYRNELFLDKEEIVSRIKAKFDLTYDNAQSYVDRFYKK